MSTGCSVDELGPDSDSFNSSADAALQDVSDARLPSYLLKVDRSALIGEDEFHPFQTITWIVITGSDVLKRYRPQNTPAPDPGNILERKTAIEGYPATGGRSRNLRRCLDGTPVCGSRRNSDSSDEPKALARQRRMSRCSHRSRQSSASNVQARRESRLGDDTPLQTA